jgi:hypothetical protein
MSIMMMGGVVVMKVSHEANTNDGDATDDANHDEDK